MSEEGRRGRRTEGKKGKGRWKMQEDRKEEGRRRNKEEERRKKKKKRGARTDEKASETAAADAISGKAAREKKGLPAGRRAAGRP